MHIIHSISSTLMIFLYGVVNNYFKLNNKKSFRDKCKKLIHYTIRNQVKVEKRSMDKVMKMMKRKMKELLTKKNS